MGFTLSQIIIVTAGFIIFVASVLYKLYRQRKTKHLLDRKVIYKVEPDIWE